MGEDVKEFTVLITDDEEFNVEILSDVLSSSYNVQIARNGESAFELATKTPPDLILLDVIMPDMSGFDLITKLKKAEITRKIPVIFVASHTDPAEEEKGLFLGAVDYIAKPFNRAIVKARVNTHIKIIDQMRTIEHIGLVDTLTEIANRRGFDERFKTEWGRAIREQAHISYMMMDIDLFKKYNDTYGHQQGDVALARFAETAESTLNRSTDFIARWGGEEFVVLLQNTNIEGTAKVAEKIRKNIEDMVITTETGEETCITVSIGVTSIIPTTATSQCDFLNSADKALYKAKASGRNRVELYRE